MKLLKFILSFLISAACVYFLNVKTGQPPPLGKFLDPFHGFWQNSYTGSPTEIDLQLVGLKDEVTVIYDSLLIPHIFANNSEDLYFAQGYITAKDRLWQMEISTHAAAGRASEILGEGALTFDRTQRRKGMVFGAKNSLDLIATHPETMSALESYASGINAYIHSLDYKSLPLEYKLLDYEPEPWEPLKTALLFMNMANTLNVQEKDIENTNFYNTYGLKLLNLIYPDYEGVSDPIVNNPGGWDFDPVRLDSVPLAVPEGLVDSIMTPKGDPYAGSNNWAVSGKKTKSGYPILCNDPHLELNLPSIWYAIQLNAPGVNTMGVSLPGSPFVTIGFNDSIAWGMTNAQRDLVDYYTITFQDKSCDRYMLDGIWVPTQKVIEAFKVRGAETVFDTVIYTNWGPVMYDRNFRPESDKKNLAFRWKSHDASDPALTFYKLNRARNHDDYMDALNSFFVPAQNFAFASVSGDIAIRIQGKYPVRRKNEGRFILDGSKSSSGWQEFIPNDQNIQVYNPERGFISSANQYPADTTYPYYITANNYEAFRNRRINKILDSLEDITPQDMMKMQNDNFNLAASEALPYFLAQINPFSLNEKEKKVYETLKSWDYYNNADSEAATRYEMWWDTLVPMAWDEIKDSKAALDYPSTYMTIKLLKDNPDLSFFDRQSTPEKETAPDIIRASFKQSVSDMEKWIEKNGDDIRWAKFKNTLIRHLTGLGPFSRHVMNGGNHGIINATSSRNGPSWRMIVSLEPSGIKAWAVYPGGQSGNPGSPYYDDLIPYWEQGQYYPLQFYPAKDPKEFMIKASLKPKE